VLNDNDFKKIIRRGLEEWVKWYSACLASVKPSVQTLVLFPPAKKKKNPPKSKQKPNKQIQEQIKQGRVLLEPLLWYNSLSLLFCALCCFEDQHTQGRL
jgi:hypothetical protein